MDNVIHSPASHSIIASTRSSNCNLFHSFMNSFQHHANVLPGRRKFNQKNPSPSHRRRRINMHTNNPSTGGFACTKLHKATEALSCPRNDPHTREWRERKNATAIRSTLHEIATQTTINKLVSPTVGSSLCVAVVLRNASRWGERDCVVWLPLVPRNELCHRNSIIQGGSIAVKLYPFSPRPQQEAPTPPPSLLVRNLRSLYL